jgi:hypothetical protein
MTVVGMSEYGAAVRIDRDGAVTYIGEQATDSVGAYVVYLTAS